MNMLLVLAGTIALAALLGFGWAFTRLRRTEAELQQARDRMIRAEALAEAAEAAKAQVGDAFKAMSAEAVNKAAEDLLKRADETFASRDRLAQERLAAQLKPVADTLAKFEAQVGEIEKARAEHHGGMKQQIEALMNASAMTQAEARRLADALKRGPGVRGRWGEQTLRNVLEAAGMAGRFDFEEQVSVAAEDGRLRPDVVVTLPGGGAFVVDSKVSLNAYLEAQETLDDAAREALMVQHAESVKRHVGDLSRKAYWEQFDRDGKRSPDFVAMFVPGDSFLCAALDRAPELMTDALARRVVIVTPTTLFALCKAVAYGWRAESQAINAAKVAELGKDLYARLSVMGAHVAGLGKALDQATGKYNAFVGSLESQVLSQARRFEDLEVDHAGKEIAELAPLENTTRPLIKLAAPAE
jgi:DNA recombination protein RmuC